VSFAALSDMKKALLCLALAGSAALAQEPAPNIQTQGAVNGTNTPPTSPGQTMGAPVPDTNAPPTATQNSGLLSPPPDNAPAANPVPVAPAPVTTATTTTPAPPASRAEIRRIEQQEVVRRQELMFRADQETAQGRKDELGQKYPDARAHYLFAVEAYGSVSRKTDRYRFAAAGLERVDFKLYDSAVQIGDTARAKMLVDEVVEYNPDDQAALEKQKRVDEAINNPNDTGILGNPAVTPELVNKVNELNDLFAQAEQFRRTGQYDEAEARLKRILGIDPYNMTATRLLERITAEKYQYSERARLEMRDERLRQVEETWYQPITNKDTLIVAQEEQPAITAKSNFDIDQKLKSIFIPSLDFTDVTIEQATNFLYTESKRLDEPAHKGIPFIIQPDASESAKTITLSLNNVPVYEALRYICQLANVKYKVQDYAVSIVPFTANIDDFISRTFVVQPSFVAPPETGTSDLSTGNGGASSRPSLPPLNGGGEAKPAALDSVQAVLEAKGVKFPTGASAVYTPATNTLTVVDTADQMELIEELVNGAQAPTLMVRIATKFVEINQVDLNDLTFNGSFNLAGVGAAVGKTLTLGLASTTPKFVTLPAANTSLPGAYGFTADSIDALINPTALVTNQLSIAGSLSGIQYAAVVQALSQKRSFDLLSEPTALTKSGEQATMEAIRVFPYPVAFDPPELVTQTNTGTVTVGSTANSNTSPPTVIATTPTDFKRRDIGVRLVIKPQITADNKTVDLSLFPEVTDFEGFINYGSQINIGNPDGTTSLLSPNDINQPVFNTRRINTKVLIRDGSTVVLGGLIREDLQTINDKVPILGDIPLIGRLFQSKATQSDKRNLIIFVTANIYQNDGELLNPPEPVNAADVLTGHAAAYNAPATQ
jgi:general secretion pathway protein D